MINNTYRYRATNYTGANVSIMIGPHLLTQCFAIDWNVSQSKRPIYGYHDQYYSGLSNGVVLVTGQLHLNFVSPGYLSTLLNRYYSFVEAIRENRYNNNGDDILNYISTHETIAPLANVIRDALDPPVGFGANPERLDRLTYQEPGILNELTERNTVDSRVRPNLDGEEIPDRMDFNMSNSERTRAMDDALNAIFDSESIQEDLIKFFTGGINTSTTLHTGENGEVAFEEAVFHADRLRSAVERNQPEGTLGRSFMNWARPDQFGDASTSPYGVDIVVHFGPPYGTVEQNQIYNYSNRSSFVLKDVSFTGEAGRIMASDEPILETYNFIARKKEQLVRSHQEING